MTRTVVWFRRDLRLIDHEPLHRAARRGAVIPVFVFDRALLQHPETGVARVAFLLECLRGLDSALRSHGGRLILRQGNPVQVLPHLIRETEADGIYAHTDCERIYGRVRDARLNRALAAAGMKIRWFDPPGSTADLMPYPHYRRLWYQQLAEPLVPVPSRLSVPADIASQPLPSLAKLGHQADGKAIPLGGTAAAQQRLQDFLDYKSQHYYWQLSYPSAAATSGLSPYLKFGVISVRQCVQTVQQASDQDDRRIQRSHQQFISRLRWGQGFTQRFRYLPQLELRSLYRVFDDEGWPFDAAQYRAWQQGQTGFPIIDAAARCLQATGGWQTLNFRCRALYASFLSNLLAMDWRYGALHFMRHLIDGDCPIDHYQWAMQAGVTHCIDKTWTRIYHPGQVAVNRCDPEGVFIKRWVPEVAHLPAQHLGCPPPTRGYPAPILKYRQARQNRVQQLQRQRQPLLHRDNLVPVLARLPQDLTPFGSQHYASDTTWAQPPTDELWPPPLPLEALDLTQAQALRTWFVAPEALSPPRPSRRRRQPTDDTVQQLSLWS